MCVFPNERRPQSGRRRRALGVLLSGATVVTLAVTGAMTGAAASETGGGRTVRADVVVLDQLLVYNRFGSFNPFGMIYALRRDVSEANGLQRRPDADWCGGLTGAEEGVGSLEAGKVRLKDCKRARPLVLRAAAGDILEVSLQNLLRPDQPGVSSAYADRPARRGDGFCKEPGAPDDAAIAPSRPDIRTAFGRKQCEDAKAEAEDAGEAEGAKPGADWPRTRGASLVIPGLEPLPGPDGKIHGACTGLDALAPGAKTVCRWRLDREGTHLFSSYAAPAGGEGLAGSLGHGLFGALIVEPKGSRFFRSQVSSKAFDLVWPKAGEAQGPHSRVSSIELHKTAPAGGRGGSACGDGEIPILEITRPCAAAGTVEIVHGDLNAVIVPGDQAMPPHDEFSGEKERRDWRLAKEAATPFREFVTIFHDELKTYYADEYKQLPMFGQMSGVRDGFAINYGASSVGTAVLANRLKIGPAANCAECLYEEFFLESWANGDPALLEAFPDDPSNVHHSYLNDKIVFRNFHAGKETHVFHLHSHQWFAGNDAGRGAYLDSQTIGPQQGFSYRIYHGGLERYAGGAATTAPKGWWDSLGSGNRNRTPGDAIFHCHLYPHFAQGMWELWRVHDVLEDGSRVLPDGQKAPGLSVAATGSAEVRSGSVGRFGEWIDAPNGSRAALGTPIPGVVPLPGFGLPPQPSYTAQAVADDVAATAGKVLETDAMPGYPFYVAGRPGHRSPQPPLDMATAAKNEAAGIGDTQIAALGGRKHLDAGLPRHVVVGGVAVPNALEGLSASQIEDLTQKKGLLARMLARGDMTSKFEELSIELQPQEGTALERNAMAFHAGAAGVKVSSAQVEGPNPPATPPVATFKPVRASPNANQSPVEGEETRTQLDPETGAYPAAAIPLAEARSGKGGDGAKPLEPNGWFAVNGSPGAPGAPFADPCAAPLVFSRSNGQQPLGSSGPTRRVYDAHKGRWIDDATTFHAVADPVGLGKDITPDPGALGFRRFDVSAVELKLIVNRAGWHDPQARINVLSKEADAFKYKARSDAEPFFFRAFSGECIEMRHTNETPKDLQLDDFQMKVPTDTIGQHIHLVKFDVTSSDGSGNGFNYEDGTFAPDEALERICKSKGKVTRRAGEADGRFEPVAERTAEECAEEFVKSVPKLVRLEGDNIKYFQTTVQRWFADPILSYSGDRDGSGVADRTMRTVFTHDHFGPSNIQQHGFYSALLIEPSPHAVCPLAEPLSSAADGKGCVAGPAAKAQPSVPSLAEDAPRDLVGARASVFQWARDTDPNDGYLGDPIHIDSREYAIAIADFALLYDGRTGSFPTPGEEDSNGVDRLIHDARHPDSTHPEDEAEEQTPARFLRDQGVALETGAIDKLVAWRDTLRAKHGKPVSAPPRPEAISQRHHDPYLVNYRNDPVPLRVGTTSSAGRPSFVSDKCRTPGAQPFETTLGADGADSIVRRRPPDQGGDLADLFRSATHGDPCTPILEGLGGDRIVIRMIQGAQEVQHNFMIEGRPGRRNVDQPFPSERPAGPEGATTASRAAGCASNAVAKDGWPRKYATWATRDVDTGIPGERVFWENFERVIAGCDNPIGYLSAQEIGISEHFEVGSLFSAKGSHYAPRILVAKPAAEPGPRVGGPTPDRPLDSLYHFGSTDALWNGAWGLIRSYDSVNAPDVTACMANNPEGSALAGCLGDAGLIGARLKPFAELRKAMNGVDDVGAPLRTTDGAKKAGAAGKSVVVARRDEPEPIASCPAGAPQVRTAVAAARAVDIWPDGPNGMSGVRYGRTLFDRDGLVLIALRPSDLMAGDLLARARERAGPSQKPYVLRVRAGDCVELTTVNLIPAQSDRWDRTGDALMPRITPLNVDRDRAQFGGTKPFGEHGLRLDTDERSQIDPSRKVALSVPLPSPQTKPHGLQPVGVNEAQALPARERHRPPARSVTVYYAGFYWPDADRILEQAKIAMRPDDQAQTAQAAPATRLSLANVSDDACDGPSGPRPTVRVLDVDLCLTPTTTDPAAAEARTAAADAPDPSDAEKEATQDKLAAHFASPVERAKVTRAIPYAFGALPIRSMGDVISHGGHGLLGTLVVEPAGLAADDTSRPDNQTPLDFEATRAQFLLVEAPAIDLRNPEPPHAALASVPAGSFREQVLLWQDGLNLRRAKNGVTDLGGAGRPLPDCMVCDDSYDLAEKAVGYRSAPFAARLADLFGAPPLLGLRHYPRDEDDLNRELFPPQFFRPEPATPTVRVKPSEEMAIRIAHPAGRARQRAFMSTATGYDDLFPGFGSGHAPLLGPGKALTAWGCAPETPGTYLWRDGPQPMFAGGAWGQLEVGHGPQGEAAQCRAVSEK